MATKKFKPIAVIVHKITDYGFFQGVPLEEPPTDYEAQFIEKWILPADSKQGNHTVELTIEAFDDSFRLLYCNGDDKLHQAFFESEQAARDAMTELATMGTYWDLTDALHRLGLECW